MRKPSCKRIGLVVFIIVFGARIASASGAPLTDLTGDWKINVEKSDFGRLFAPKAAAVKITQEGATIRLAESETNAQDETNRVESTLTTDGAQCSGTLIATPYPVTGVMAWNNGSLTFDGGGSSGGVDFKVHEDWALSGDKATITITRHFSSARGNTDQTLVLEKQLVAKPGGSTGAAFRLRCVVTECLRVLHPAAATLANRMFPLESGVLIS
jgi:hypothetical protein